MRKEEVEEEGMVKEEAPGGVGGGGVPLRQRHLGLLLPHPPHRALLLLQTHLLRVSLVPPEEEEGEEEMQREEGKEEGEWGEEAPPALLHESLVRPGPGVGGRHTLLRLVQLTGEPEGVREVWHGVIRVAWHDITRVSRPILKFHFAQ